VWLGASPDRGRYLKEIMPDSFKKRQKEALRREKQRDKAAKRMHRKEAARGGDKSEPCPHGDFNVLEADAPETVTELESYRSQISLSGSTTGSLQDKG
jgi:hypothetical protein